MRFDWDWAKNRANIRKHRIAFADAVEIFEHCLMEWRQENSEAEYGEVRMNSIGLMQGFEVFAVYVERGEVIRFISVRKAEDDEREDYYGYCASIGN